MESLPFVARCQGTAWQRATKKGQLRQEQVVIVPEVKDPVASAASHFGHDAKTLQISKEAVGGNLAETQARGQRGAGGERPRIKVIHHSGGIGGPTAQRLEAVGGVLAEVVNGLKSADTLLGGFIDGHEEEFDPARQIPSCAHGGESVVIGRPVLFQVVGNVQAGAMEEAFAHQIQGDEETANPAIAIYG